jgi:hypothetical protein
MKDQSKVRYVCCFPKPGQFETMSCWMCGSTMEVTRDVMGPTCFAEAMLVRDGRSQGRLHDEYWCPLDNEPWHRQAQAIRENAEETPSQRLADLLTDEADEIVRTRQATKEGW